MTSSIVRKVHDYSGLQLAANNFCEQDLRSSKFRFARLAFAKFRYASLNNSDFTGSNLQYADFTGATLKDCKLQDAIINYAIGNMREIRSMQLESWQITFTEHVLAIGCRQYSWEEWNQFSDGELELMDEYAPSW
jgi:hypothetical protein